jgi:hypothetical protein
MLFFFFFGPLYTLLCAIDFALDLFVRVVHRCT